MYIMSNTMVVPRPSAKGYGTIDPKTLGGSEGRLPTLTLSWVSFFHLGLVLS